MTAPGQSDLIPGQWAFDEEGRAAQVRACALEECGRSFLPAAPTQAYCSRAHKQKAYRRRQGVPRGSGRHHW